MNKFLPIKIICIILALAVAAYAGITTVGFAEKAKAVYDEGDFDDFIVDYFKKGKNVDLFSSSVYKHERNDEIASLQSLIKLGDGSRKAYHAYLGKYKSTVAESIENLGIKKKGECYNGNELLAALANDDADLDIQRIEVHKSHSLTATLDGKETPAYFDASSGQYIVDKKYLVLPDGSVTGRVFNFTSNNDVVHYDIEYYSDDEEYPYTTLLDDDAAVDVDEILTEPAASEASVNTEKITINDSVGTKLPKSVREKESSLPVIEICNAVFERELYDGWYSVVPTDGSYGSITTVSSFDQYKKTVRNCKEALNELPFDYAVVSADKKELLVTNVDSLNGKSAKDVYSYFTSDSPAETLYWSYEDLIHSDGEYIESLDPDSSRTDYIVCFRYSGSDADEQAYIEEYTGFCDSLTEWIITVGVCVLLLLLLLILLIVFSGKKGPHEDAKIRFSDRIFILIRLCLNSGLIALLAVATWSLAEMYLEKKAVSDTAAKGLAALICSASVLVVFDLALYFARNIKAHKLHERFFVVWLFKKIADAHRKKAEKLAELPPVLVDIKKDVTKLSLTFFVPLLFVALMTAIFNASGHPGAVMFFGTAALLWIIGWGVYAFGYIRDLKVILRSLAELGEGNTGITIDPAGMNKRLQPFVFAFNKVSYGSKAAVEKAVREQNTKTELITNISHDLKTPLTSIINYVDLLSKTDINDEKAKEYIEILGEKSSRLKRLIEDLIEASKATTGNVEVHLMMMSFNELCRQIVGEYEDEMQANGLELISEIADEDIAINADQRMIYRVLDNLMNNARKYSLSGTRVYLKLEKDGMNAAFTLKNISASGLNISADELKQRFVRGDTSRTENGSGLGLSIAESFCELMGAKLDLEIDGDMFTSKVVFPVVYRTE